MGIGDRRQLFLLQLLDGVLVIPQIQLGAHQDDGRGGAVMTNLGVPLETGRKEGVKYGGGSVCTDVLFALVSLDFYSRVTGLLVQSPFFLLEVLQRGEVQDRNTPFSNIHAK